MRAQRHRIIEIGAVGMINRRPTDNRYPAHKATCMIVCYAHH